MFKIAVFADIHANCHALKVIMNDINNKMFDEVICLGDILSKGPNPKECLDLIIDNDINAQSPPGSRLLSRLLTGFAAA